MEAYLDLVDRILRKGIEKPDRTGVGTLSISGQTFKHDMQDGFPLLTTKKMPFKSIATELEFFIRGLTDKKWLQERGCHIWDEWCNPAIVPYAHDEETKKRMLEERDLGPVYGFQWRHLGAEYRGYDFDYTRQGEDQLSRVVDLLKTEPNSRRMVVNAWNPEDLRQMALEPCHYSWQVIVMGDKLDLIWNQRSVDTMLGLPFNIASYGLLLHLLARESGLKEGTLTGFLGDTHIYKNHIENAKNQLFRRPFPLPKIETPNFPSIFNWQNQDSNIRNYQSHPKIGFEIAV